MKSKVMELAKGISLSIGMLQTYDPDLVKQLESLCHVSSRLFSNCIAGIEDENKGAGYSIHIAQSHDILSNEKEIKSMIESNVCAI